MTCGEPELAIRIRMLLAFFGFPRALQAVVQVPQDLRDRLVTDRMTLVGQLRRQNACAFARPAERRLRITAAQRFDQRLEPLREVRVAHVNRRPARAGAPYPSPQAEAPRPIPATPW